MSRETRRNEASEESDTKTSEMSTGRLAYPESRAAAALQTWQREMLLYLGGKELSHVAEDYSEDGFIRTPPGSSSLDVLSWSATNRSC